LRNGKPSWDRGKEIGFFENLGKLSTEKEKNGKTKAVLRDK